MFGIESKEMLFILLAVLILFGPRRIPEVARALGKGLGDIRDALSGVEREIRDAADSAEGRRAPPTPPAGALPVVTNSVPAVADATRAGVTIGDGQGIASDPARADASGEAKTPPAAPGHGTDAVRGGTSGSTDPDAPAEAGENAVPAATAEAGGTGDLGAPAEGHPPPGRTMRMHHWEPGPDSNLAG